MGKPRKPCGGEGRDVKKAIAKNCRTEKVKGVEEKRNGEGLGWGGKEGAEWKPKGTPDMPPNKQKDANQNDGKRKRN
jgi:hypothetical protein